VLELGATEWTPITPLPAGEEGTRVSSRRRDIGGRAVAGRANFEPTDTLFVFAPLVAIRDSARERLDEDQECHRVPEDVPR
jgi:hypothetical protein